MPKIKARDFLILTLLSVLLSCGLVSGLDWHNQEKMMAFASGEGEILSLVSGQSPTIAWNGDSFLKISQSFLGANGANLVSLDQLGSLTVMNSDGTTKTYSNQLAQTLKLSENSNVQMVNSYTLTNDQSILGTSMSFTNPKTGMTFNMAEVDPNDPTKLIQGFVDAMDLGMSYERIQGLQYNIGVVDSEEITKDGMKFEYSLGKNTEIRA